MTILKDRTERKYLLIAAIIVCTFVLIGYAQEVANNKSCDIPKRLVIIQGKVTISGGKLPGEMAAPGDIIFQKVGCASCFIGARADSDGKYNITVGDGKYKVIVRDPSAPDSDYLAPDQERFIDTQTLEAKMNSQQVFDFNVRLRRPAEK